MDRPPSSRRPLAVAGALFALAACATDPGPHPARPVPAAGTLAGADAFVVTEAQPAPLPPVMVSPAGRVIVPGTVDELGYVLPLDVRRPRPPRVGTRPPLEEIARRRALAAPSSFLETRLGPDDGHTQNETSIAISGDTLIAGWNQFDDSSAVMGAARSADRGRTWSWQLLEVHDTLSDPAVKAGGAGRWYYAYLGIGGVGGSDAEIFVRRSLDDGVTWQQPVAVTNDADFDDKPYLDARGDEVLVAWADFGFSPARIRAARSLDGGQTFAFDTVLVDASGGGNGASPVIASDGSWYVFWRDSFQDFLWMSRSTDQGQTWSPDASIVAMNPLPSTMPGGFRMVNLPIAAADPATGDLVVVWNDQLFGNPDVLAIRSSDHGATWSAPVRVNDDAGTAAQFFPWVTIDAAGVVYVVWYDRRQNGFDIDVYLAWSTDGGATFSPNLRVTGMSFTPVLPSEGGAAPFIGDYNAVAADTLEVFPFYQDARAGVQDVYVAVVPSPLGLLFADAFESGDLGAWSAAQPP